MASTKVFNINFDDLQNAPKNVDTHHITTPQILQYCLLSKQFETFTLTKHSRILCSFEFREEKDIQFLFVLVAPFRDNHFGSVIVRQ
jgi:hypothetical protein